jgi:hypothetical protein
MTKANHGNWFVLRVADDKKALSIWRALLDFESYLTASMV